MKHLWNSLPPSLSEVLPLEGNLRKPKGGGELTLQGEEKSNFSQQGQTGQLNETAV